MHARERAAPPGRTSRGSAGSADGPRNSRRSAPACRRGGAAPQQVEPRLLVRTAELSHPASPTGRSTHAPQTRRAPRPFPQPGHGARHAPIPAEQSAPGKPRDSSQDHRPARYGSPGRTTHQGVDPSRATPITTKPDRSIRRLPPGRGPGRRTGRPRRGVPRACLVLLLLPCPAARSRRRAGRSTGGARS